MKVRSFFRRATVAAMAFTVSCGGDATGPTVELTEAQVDEMMGALTAAGMFEMIGSSAESKLGAPSGMALASVNVSATNECPLGGTTGISGTMTTNDQTEAFSMSFTQTFTGCKATAEATQRLWTFDGNPSVTTSFNGTVNPTSGASTITGSQTGGIRFSSDLGTGVCNVNISFSFTEDAEGGVGGSITGTMCGRTIEFDFSATGE